MDAVTLAIVEKYTLNPDQVRALQIITTQLRTRVPPLLIGVFGEGGTGKSLLIETIRA
jgi:putative protein kinase ArgK-like GTPase of G3E family